MSPRDANRLMQRMGMELKQLDDINRVIFEGPGRRIIIENPEVAAVTVQGQTMYQVGGGKVKEEAAGTASTIASAPTLPSPGDAAIVAQQAGVSQHEAEEALRNSGGDLAQAIIYLQKRKSATHAR